jgi:putative NADH-flavin reductase
MKIAVIGGDALEWGYISPPPKDLTPGDRRGGYRAAAGNRAVTDAQGEGRITAGDLASAVVDELESPRFVGERFTAAYA